MQVTLAKLTLTLTLTRIVQVTLAKLRDLRSTDGVADKTVAKLLEIWEKGSIKRNQVMRADPHQGPRLQVS